MLPSTTETVLRVPALVEARSCVPCAFVEGARAASAFVAERTRVTRAPLSAICALFDKRTHVPHAVVDESARCACGLRPESRGVLRPCIDERTRVPQAFVDEETGVLCVRTLTRVRVFHLRSSTRERAFCACMSTSKRLLRMRLLTGEGKFRMLSSTTERLLRVRSSTTGRALGVCLSTSEHVLRRRLRPRSLTKKTA